MLYLTHKCGGARSRSAHAQQRVLNDPREKGSSGENEAEPGRLTRLFTLHDASLDAIWGAEG
jgi:hypothetical protein